MSQIVSFSLEGELRDNPNLKESDIKALSEWCQKEPHLPRISESSLAVFLHGNYYRVEPTKMTIDRYYTIRTHLYEVFSGRDPLDRKHFGNALILPLQQQTRKGYNILFLKLLNADASEFEPVEYVKLVHMVLDLWLYRSGTNDGHVIVYDVREFGLGHAARCNPMFVKAVLYYLQEGLPVRLKGMHFMNVNAGTEALLKIMKPFFKREMSDTLHLHSSLESLEKLVPIEALPNEMGGKAGPLMELYEAELKKLEASRDWFLEEESRSRVDETKRSGAAKSRADYFGIDGSFKKLDCD